MEKFDDLARRLRARVDRSASRERSLDWRAADAIEQLQARNEALQAENKRLDVEHQAFRERSSASELEEQNEAEAKETAPALTHALDLREAAALLNVSYSTVYAHKEEIGFFQIGNQWRVWPDTLRENLQKQSEQKAANPEPSKPDLIAKPRRTSRTYVPMSASQAERELDKVLEQIRPKRRR